MKSNKNGSERQRQLKTNEQFKWMILMTILSWMNPLKSII